MKRFHVQEVIKMKINITVPSNYEYSKLVKKTKIYMKGSYNKNIASTVFEGKDRGYYAWIKRGGIQIEVISKTKDNIVEIQNYLEFLFYQKYIGISVEDNEKLDLEIKNIKCFKV